MKAFGLKPEHLDTIYQLFEQHLAGFPDVKVWIFGSRAKGKHKPNSDIDLTISSRSKKAKAAVSLIKTDLEESNLPFTVDVVWWGEMAKSFIPEVKKTRIPFWDPTLVEKRNPWRICPLGQSWVQTYDKPTINVTDVDGHCRRNKKGKDVIFLDELKKIEASDIFSKAVSPRSFKSNPTWGAEFDRVIGGWTAYWNEIMEEQDQLDPNLVKVLIASESSFDPKAGHKQSKQKRGAIGLIQVMPKTVSILKDYNGEIKEHYISVSYEDLIDPSVSVAAGIRWLFRKKALAEKKLKRKVTWYEAVLDYKGVLKQDSKSGKNPVIRKRLDQLAADLDLVLK